MEWNDESNKVIKMQSEQQQQQNIPEEDWKHRKIVSTVEETQCQVCFRMFIAGPPESISHFCLNQ